MATSDSSRTPSLETRAASILGTKYLDGLSSIAIDLGALVSDADSRWNVQGLVSYSPSSPHPFTARETHLFSINGRPVDLPNVSRLVGDVWKGFDSESGRRPACILSFTLPNHVFDVNLSPDKRQVMFTEESLVLNLIREGLTKHWSGQSEGKFQANEVESSSNAKPERGSKEAITISDAKACNKITPKSIQKNTSGASPPVQQPSFTTEDQKVITPTITQTQSDGSTNKYNSDMMSSEEKIAEDEGIRHELQPTKSSLKELKAWEQMKLNFDRINKSQRRKDLDQFLSTDDAARDEEESTVLTGISKKTEMNRTPAAGKKMRTCAMVAKMSEELVESQIESPNTDISNSNAIHFQVEKETKSAVETETSSLPKQKVTLFSDNSLDDFAFGSFKSNNTHSGNSDDEESDSNGKLRCKTTEVASYSGRKARAKDLASKSGTMIVGKRIISARQAIQGRARDKETMQLSLPQKDWKKNGTMWSSFLGTQCIIDHSRQSQVLMRKRRKLLHQSVKLLDENQDTVGSEGSENSVSLCQDDFLHMSIVGQFNLGFILARCRNNNLWMLDQHACDEKYNFELLCKETVIHEQKLLTPLQLELSPSEEHCILENMDVFERNGFRFEYNTENEPRKRLSLTALPHSGSGGDGTKAVQFGKEGE